MKSIWRKNLIITLILGLLAIPVYFVDEAFTSGGGGGWITLNFRGLIFETYVALIAIHAVLSTLSVHFFPLVAALPRYLATFLMSLILFAGGFYAWGLLDDMAHARQIRALEAKRAPLANVIELKEWWYYPDSIAPTEIRVSVVVHSAGRFDGLVRGNVKRADGSSDLVFISGDDLSHQRRVKKDDAFIYHFTLQFRQPGPANSVRITLWLFDPEVAPDARSIAKTYISSPSDRDEGDDFFSPLPPPIQK
jgi:hypothetical protein